MSVEHDRTVPPMGAIISAQIQRASDGEYELSVEYDVFPDPLPVVLADGTEAYEQHSNKERHAFATATIESSEMIGVAVDNMNFESHGHLERFYTDLHDLLDTPIEEQSYGRKALISDPELVITLSLKAALIWLAIRASTGVAEAVSDIAKEETKKLYGLIRTTIIKYVSYARPKNRPITYVLRVPGTPNIEFIARSSDANSVISAFTDGSISTTAYTQLEILKDTLHPEFIQFMLSDEGNWHFNYLLTNDGSVIGIKQAYDRRAVLLEEISKVKKQDSDTDYNQ